MCTLPQRYWLILDHITNWLYNRVQCIRAHAVGKRKNADSSRDLPDPKTLGGREGDKAAADRGGGPDIYGHYRSLLGQKLDLKKRLKRFDDDFARQHGRQPRKADKEVHGLVCMGVRKFCRIVVVVAAAVVVVFHEDDDDDDDDDDA